MKRFVLASCIVVVLLGGIVSYVQLGPIRTLLSIQKSFQSHLIQYIQGQHLLL